LNVLVRWKPTKRKTNSPGKTTASSSEGAARTKRRLSESKSRVDESGWRYWTRFCLRYNRKRWGSITTLSGKLNRRWPEGGEFSGWIKSTSVAVNLSVMLRFLKQRSK